MSAYSAAADINNWIPAEVVRQLTDDNDTGNTDVEKLNDCIRRAGAYIDSWLIGRYDVPVPAPIPDMINDISTKLTIYYLYKRSLALTIPDPIADDYKTACRTLVDIQRGRVNPFPVAENPVIFRSNKTGIDMATATMTSNWQRYPL